jgi:hypothetical protein
MQEVDMAKASTISDFLQDGLRRYPPDGARKYMLVFWDHGSGWQGYGADATCSNLVAYSEAPYCDAASVQTVADGVAAGLAGVTDPATGGPLKLDIIGFDACLMAMYEVAALLSPHAHYLLASELLEPGYGWDYSRLGYLVLGAMDDHSAVSAGAGFSAPQVASLLINGYMDMGLPGLTLALLDLTKVQPALEASLTSLAGLLAQQLPSSPSERGRAVVCVFGGGGQSRLVAVG